MPVGKPIPFVPPVTKASGPRQKPGEKPHRDGEFVERGPRGGQVPKPRQVTIEPGDNRLPPTQKPGRGWERIGPPKP